MNWAIFTLSRSRTTIPSPNCVSSQLTKITQKVSFVNIASEASYIHFWGPVILHTKKIPYFIHSGKKSIVTVMTFWARKFKYWASLMASKIRKWLTLKWFRPLWGIMIHNMRCTISNLYVLKCLFSQPFFAPMHLSSSFFLAQETTLPSYKSFP